MAILSGTLNGPLAFGVAGPSAYEVAVKNGFVGSEEAWLDSLRGEPFVYEDFTPEQLSSLKGKQGDPGKDGDDGFSPEVTVEKAGKVTTITIKDASGTYTAKINDGADGKNGQDGADGKDSVGVVIYRTTADLTDELADSIYPFMLYELDTTGGTPEVGDWIIDKYSRLYQIVDAYGDTFDGEWIATLSREGGDAEDGGYYIPNVELLENNYLKFSYTATKEGMPEISDRYFELPDSGGNVDLTGYATEQWVQNQKYLTEVPEGYAKTEDIPTKPEDIGAQPSGNYALKSEIPSVPVQSVNGKTGAVKLSAPDVGARPDNWMPSAQEVGALPNTYTPPNQTAEQVGADPKGTATSAVSQHNTADDSHNDIRMELKAINDRLTAFFDSDDQTLDELSEIVAYITSNKSLIDAITTSKVNVTDIVNNLITNVSNKPLSAAQGVVLKGLLDELSGNLANYQPKGDYLASSELPAAINTALAQAKASGEFNGQPGKTPVRGTDYWTASDIAEIKSYVDTAILGGAW